MKFNISYGVTGQQKCIDIDDDKKIHHFYDKRLGNEIEGSVLGDTYKGYVFKITGGNDKDGFPMKQGVMSNRRVRLLMSEGHSCYKPRRTGERKRKSIRGCILGPDLAVVALTVVQKGDQDLPGLTDAERPRRLGPKRANHIRKTFNLKKDDDVRRYVVRRAVEKKGKTFYKSPKIQRLITDKRLRRKRLFKRIKKERWEASKKAKSEYEKVLSTFLKEKRSKRELVKKAKKEERAHPHGHPAENK